MTPEEYWSSEGIRFLNEDGTLPSVEQRVREGYQRGWENAWAAADEIDESFVSIWKLCASSAGGTGRWLKSSPPTIRLIPNP